jgi:taurine dioxygenase
MLTTKPLPGFGVEISGVDLSQPLDETTQKALLKVFHENGVILLREQNMDFGQFERFAAVLGHPKRHFLDHLRWRDHPSVLLLSNVFENDKAIGVYEGAAFWHTDVAYEDPPNSSTAVYGIEWPDGGCPTYIADMFRAYDALSDSMKNRIDDLMVLHHYGNRDDLNEESTTSAEKLTNDQKGRVENVFHPLVKRHPVTGRKALYGVAGSSFGIDGMAEEGAFSLLDELKEHALQDEFVMSLDIKVGEIGVWDTFSTLHKATALKPATGETDRRLLWRISVTGVPPVLE